METRTFVAREQQLQQLEKKLDLMLEGQGQIALITGEAGAGKTALIHHFVAQALEKHPDLLVTLGNCNAHTGVGDPYLPFREALGLLVGIVDTKSTRGAITEENGNRIKRFMAESGRILVEVAPDLVGAFVPGGAIVSALGRALAVKTGVADKLDEIRKKESSDIEIGRGLSEQSQVLEQYTNYLQTVARHHPLVIVIDDLHWTDAASSSLLFHLARRIQDNPIFIIGTYRSTELFVGQSSKSHPFAGITADLKRYFGDITIDLDKTSDSEDKAFIDRMIDIEPNRLGESFRKKFLQLTNGHPLFTVELLRHMQENGDLLKDETGLWIAGNQLDWKNFPARAEGVIEGRIQRLDAQSQEILSTASLQGEKFIGEVIARVLSLEEKEVIKRLSGELCKVHKIVSPHSTHKVNGQRVSVYKFEHNLFQQYLINNIDDIEKGYLHEETGKQLEELYQDDAGEIAPQLARHYLEASIPEKAIKYLVLSGDKARRLYDVNEALNYYQQALNLANGADGYSFILERRARILLELYRGKEAVADYENLLSNAKKNKDQNKELNYLLGLAQSSYVVALDSPEPDAASKSYISYRQAYSLAKKLEDKRGMVHALLQIPLFRDFINTNGEGTLVTSKQALQDIKEAVALSESISEENLTLDSKIALHDAFRKDGQVEEAEHLGESLLNQLVNRGDLLRLNRLYFQLMWTHLSRANFAKCVEICDSAITLADKIGIPPVQYATVKALALSKSGNFDAAWQSLENEIADQNHPFGKAFKDFGSGSYFLDLMAYEQAFEILTSASEQGKRLGRAWMVRGAQEGLAIALLESGNLNKDNLENIRQELDELGSTLPEMILGEIDLAAHKFDAALEKAISTANEATKTGRRGYFLHALELQTRVLLALNRHEEVLLLVDQGIQMAEETGYGTMLWRLLGTKAEALDSIGKHEEAGEQYDLAARTIGELADTISDNKLNQGFLSHPHIASILAKAAKGKQRRSN